MILMILPAYPGGKIDAAIINNLIRQLYKELYNRDASDVDPDLLSQNNDGQVELI